MRRNKCCIFAGFFSRILHKLNPCRIHIRQAEEESGHCKKKREKEKVGKRQASKPSINRNEQREWEGTLGREKSGERGGEQGRDTERESERENNEFEGAKHSYSGSICVCFDKLSEKYVSPIFELCLIFFSLQSFSVFIQDACAHPPLNTNHNTHLRKMSKQFIVSRLSRHRQA